jgi:predicted RND superfamily exporter protein
MLARLLAQLADGIAKRPKATLIILTILTALLATGIPRVQLETNILDWLPASDPRVQALAEVIERVDGVTNQELVWLELDPNKAARAGVNTITDEAAIRAQEELGQFVQTLVPEVRFTFGLPHWLKVANATLNSEQKTPGLPESSAQFTLLWNGVWRTQRNLLQATISADRQGTLLGFVVEGDPTSAAGRRVGLAIRDAVREYVSDESKTYDLFRDDVLFPVGLASGLATIDQSLADDLRWLVPLGGLLIALLLLMAFRSTRMVLVAGLCLMVAAVWLFGVMGYAGLSLNVVNAALLPLLLGSGIDYAIHFLNAYQAARSHTPEHALAQASQQAGGGMILVTITSICGLAALLLAGVPSIAQLGLLASISLVLLLAIVLVLPTALYSLHDGKATNTFRASTRLQVGLGYLQQHPRATLVLFAILASLMTILWQAPKYQLDVIQGNFPPQDPTRQALETMRAGVAGALPEFIIIEGDMSRPEVLEYSQAIASELDSNLNARLITPGLMLESYLSLQQGFTGALGQVFGSQPELPASQNELRKTLVTMHQNPLWAPLIKLVSSQDLNLSVLIVMPESSDDLTEVREVLETMQQAINAPTRPHNVNVSVIGYRSISLLFIETSLRWLQRLFVASLFATCLVAAIAFRDVRVVVALASIVSLTGIAWFALLPLLDVYVSVFLLFPLVFLVSLGSDYALHLFWHARLSDDIAQVYGETGKAVLFSALTDAAAFGLFSLAYLTSVRQVMRASSLAVVLTLLATFLIVPLTLRFRSGRSVHTMRQQTSPVRD